MNYLLWIPLLQEVSDRANHTQTEVIVSSSFGIFLKDLWTLKEQNINPFNSQDLIVNSPL